MNLIRIAITDDLPVLITGLKFILQSHPEFSIDIEALNGHELLDKIKTAPIKPDVCLLDLSMPIMDGYATLVKLKEAWPGIEVIILTQHYNEYSIIKTICDGASACLPKEVDIKEIHHAIHEVVEKGYYHTEFVAKHMSSSLRSGMKKIKITDKEKEFLIHCCSDYSYQQIAGIMKLSCRTIEGYRDNLFLKINVKSRSALVMFAIQAGIASIR